VELKCLDVDAFEEIPFGHVFPEESSDIDKLFEEKESGAADWYVKVNVSKVVGSVFLLFQVRPS
jgi:hypothetical protein